MKRLVTVMSMLSLLAVTATAGAEITIGVNLSTTGPAASLGIPEKNTISAFAPTTIGGEKVRFIVLDDASDTTAAVQNVKRLISEDHIDLLIGTTITPTSLAIINVVAESKTPMISPASGSAIILPMDAKRRWIFKTPPNDDVYNTATVNHMVKKGVKTVSVIAVDDAYGESNTQAYKILADQKKIKTLQIVKFKRTDTSTTAQALRVMKDNPDAVYIVASGTPAAMPHRELVERGYKGKIYQTGGAANSDFLRVGGKALEGSFISASPILVAEQLPDGYPTKKAAHEFLKAYEPKFGPRSIFACEVWDELKLLEVIIPKALKVAKPGTEKFRAALRDAMEGIRQFRGAFAMYTLSPTDHNGVDQIGMALIRVENGTWKLEDLSSHAFQK